MSGDLDAQPGSVGSGAASSRVWPAPAADAHLPGSPLGAFRETRLGWLVLAAVWAASVAYLGAHLREGWIPSDAGMLAQMAERVLQGQIPFRDYIDNYTGGLTYLNGLAFRLFGTNFFSLRIPLFLFFVGWVPSVYFIARRFAGPLAAGAVTLLSVAWSVPNYPEAMPSWYNLFFATWGVLALFRYTESDKKCWLWIAGLCGGLSFLVKVSGLYFIGAALLFFVFREGSPRRAARVGRCKDGLFYRLFVSAGLVLFVLFLAALISTRPTLTEFVNFVLPSTCLVGLTLAEVWRSGSKAGPPVIRRLLGTTSVFLAGALSPLFFFLLWFWHKGALADWFNGVFVAPQSRTAWAAFDPLSTFAALASILPVVLIVVLSYDRAPLARRLSRYGSPIALAVLLLAASRWREAYVFVGFSPSLVVVFVALAATLCLWRFPETRDPGRDRVFLIVAASVVCALVRFPYSRPIYFSYVAPLAVLAITALLSTRPPNGRVAIGSLLGFYLVFAVWLRPPGYWIAANAAPGESLSFASQDLTRTGGLRLQKSNAKEYAEIVALVRAHASGPYIYCTPDCPEVYFLTDKLNPTGTIYDLLDPDFLDILARTHRIIDMLDRHDVSVVVLNTKGLRDSGHIPAPLRTALDAQYPESQKIGGFQVRWKRWNKGRSPP